jgi:hypothetical protein
VQSSLAVDIHRAYLNDPVCFFVCRELIQYLSASSESKRARLYPLARSRVCRYHLDHGILYYHIDSADVPRVVVPATNTSAPGSSTGTTTILLLVTSGARELSSRSLAHFIGHTNTAGCVSGFARVRTANAVNRSGSAGVAIPADVWYSVSLDFVFGFPKDSRP